MPESIRLRRHTDGRVAVRVNTENVWIVTHVKGGVYLTRGDANWSDDWTELFVAELPEPDYSLEMEHIWDLHTGEIVVNEITGELSSCHLHTEHQLQSDALKMLAAVAAHERLRGASDDAGQ